MSPAGLGQAPGERKEMIYITKKGLKRCPVCNKTFFTDVPEMWAYRLKIKGQFKGLACSYGCFRKFEKAHPTRKEEV